jgi:hypothetical protein
MLRKRLVMLLAAALAGCAPLSQFYETLFVSSQDCQTQKIQFTQCNTQTVLCPEENDPRLADERICTQERRGIRSVPARVRFAFGRYPVAFHALERILADLDQFLRLQDAVICVRDAQHQVFP